MSAPARTLPPALPISLATIDRWIRAGLLHLDRPGSGRRRQYPPAEMAALLALVDVGASTDGETWTPERRTLLADVADAARSNPPGAVVEIASPVPYVWHILIVPAP